MPIEVKITGDTWPEVQHLLATAPGEVGGDPFEREGADQLSGAPEKPTKRAGRPTKAEAAEKAAKENAAAAGTVAPPSPAGGAAAAAPTLDDLRAVMKRVHAKVVKYEKFVEICQAHFGKIAGVAESSKIPDDKRAAVIAALQAELAKAPAPEPAVGEGMI